MITLYILHLILAVPQDYRDPRIKKIVTITGFIRSWKNLESCRIIWFNFPFLESHGKLCSWHKITKVAYVVVITKQEEKLKKMIVTTNFVNNCLTLIVIENLKRSWKSAWALLILLTVLIVFLSCSLKNLLWQFWLPWELWIYPHLVWQRCLNKGKYFFFTLLPNEC